MPPVCHSVAHSDCRTAERDSFPPCWSCGAIAEATIAHAFIRQPANISAKRWLIYKHRNAQTVQGEYVKGPLFLSGEHSTWPSHPWMSGAQVQPFWRFKFRIDRNS